MPTVISVGAAPNGIATNSVTHRTYVANTDDDSVSVIDNTTNTVIATISMGAGSIPYGVAVNTTTNKVYVSMPGAHALGVIDGSTNTFSASVTGLSGPLAAVAVDESYNYVFVTSNASLLAINGATNTYFNHATVAAGAISVAINPTTNTAYVGSLNPSTSAATLSIVNLFTYAVMQISGIGSAGVAVNPTTNKVYATTLFSPTLSIIDGTTHAVSSAALPGGATFQGFGITVDPVADVIYVLTDGVNIAAINGVNNRQLSTVPAGSSPIGVSVDTGLNVTYASNQDDATVFVNDGAVVYGGTISLVQSATSTSTLLQLISVDLPSPITSGNTLIACVSAKFDPADFTSLYPNKVWLVYGPYGEAVWMRAVSNVSNGSLTEIWYCRGVGSTTSQSIEVGVLGFETAAVTIMEFEGIWYADPLDFVTSTNSINYSSGTPVATAYYEGATPYRATNELQIAVCQTSGSVSAVSTPNTLVSSPSSIGAGVAYQITPSTPNPSAVGAFFTGSDGDWCSSLATFLPGPSGVNPNLQFPETLVLMNGTGVNSYSASSLDQDLSPWLNITSYIRSMSIGPLGRQHELDRVQATQATITVNNRTGEFNPWNENSILNNCWSGLLPMAPVKITAQQVLNQNVGSGTADPLPVFYGYLQSVTPSITDVMNVEADLAFVDFLGIMALKNISGQVYADTILADGPSGYYRLGDAAGSLNVIDSSGNGNDMVLVTGPAGFPLYGSNSAFLSDPNTSVDLTNGTEMTNGGITNINTMTSPPTVVQPLNSVQWTFEGWTQWTGAANGVAALPTTVNASASVSVVDGGPYFLFTDGSNAPSFQNNQLVTGSGIPNDTYAVIVTPPFFAGSVEVQLNNPTTVAGSVVVQTYETQYTIFSAVNGSGHPFTIALGATLDANGIFGPLSTTIYQGRVFAGNISDGAIYPVVISTESNLLDGGWHHIVVTFDGTYLNLYVDGALSFQSATAGFGYDFTNLVQPSLGSDISNPAPWSRPIPGSPSNGFAGNMQDIALYQYALTSDQVANHYDVGKWFSSIEVGAATGDASAGRLNKVLKVIGADPAQFLVMGSGNDFKTELYAETNTLTTTSALNYMQTITESEPGLIFQGPDGMMYAYNRQYQYQFSPYTNVAIVSDSDAGSPYDGPSLQIVQDDLDVWNDIQVQSGRPANLAIGQTAGVLQEWGPVQSSAASVSSQKYGPRTLQGLTSLQMEHDSDALAIAQNYLNWYVEPIVRTQQVVLSSAFDGGNEFGAMVATGLWDIWQVQYHGQTPSTPFVGTYLIEQIQHDITIDNGPEWRTTWALSPYEILMYPFPMQDTATSASVGGNVFEPPDGITTGQLTL